MPSVTDVHQQSSNNHGKSTPPPPATTAAAAQQQQNNLVSGDGNIVDGITQAILALEKKQRNLVKRKEKLESYENEAKTGKELHKDQKEALAKYPEVLGQIECAKELHEQFKKIQTESNKNQKRLSKQAAEEKRLQMSQRLSEYAQLRHLLDHRPKSLKAEESTLLDELSRLILPKDNSPTSLSRSVDTVLSIYHGGPSVPTIKTLTGKTPQEIREILEQLIKDSQNQSSSSTCSPSNIELQPEEEQKKDIDQIIITTATPTTTNDNEDLTSRTNYIEYPLQFDTRNQNIPLEQIIEDSPFFSNDLTQTQDNHLHQSNETKQYSSTHSTLNSNLSEQSLINNCEQTNLLSTDQQQSEEAWQQPRSNTNNQRNNQFNPANRNYHQRPSYNSYYQSQQQPFRGTRGGRYDGSYSGGTGQRSYSDNPTRGRPTSNSNYRGNRGGNYRGGFRANGIYQGDANIYPKSSQYQQNNEQQAPPSSDQQ